MKGIQSRLPLLLFFLIVLYVYLVFLPVTYNFDGTVFSHYLRYALVENDLQSVVQLHHLHYLPLNYWIYKTANTLFAYQPLEYYHLQLFSLFFALLSLIFIYKIVKALGMPLFFQLVTLFSTAFSYLFWIQGVEAEVHMAGFFFITAGLYYLWFKKETLTNLSIAALLLAVASGFHLSNGLIALSALALLLVRRVKMRRVVQFYTLYATFFLLPYLLLKMTTRVPLLATARDILIGKEKLTGYTYTGTALSRWRGLSFKNLAHNGEAIKNSILCPETGFLGWILLLVMLLALVMMWKRVKQKNFLILCLAWGIPYFIFFNFWQPGNSEFKLNVVVPILLAFGYTIQFCPWQNGLRPLLATILIAVGSANLFLAINPQNRLANNKNYQLAMAINEKTTSQSTILIAGSGNQAYRYGKIYLPYFALRKTMVLDWKLGKKVTFTAIAKEIDLLMKQGQRVYILSELTAPTPTLTSLLRFHHISMADYQTFLSRLNLSREIPLPNQYYLVEVTDSRGP